mgnify:CR=1 FL=1
MPSNEWKFARHIDNALVINLGDAMHFLSGGFFKGEHTTWLDHALPQES